MFATSWRPAFVRLHSQLHIQSIRYTPTSKTQAWQRSLTEENQEFLFACHRRADRKFTSCQLHQREGTARKWMSVSSAPARAVSLYRQILRAAIYWPDAEETRYIRSEAGKQFHANRDVRGAELEAALKEAETRLHYAQHYGIPYPRLHHTKVRSRFAPKVDGFGHTVPHTSDSTADSKLAQAAKRIGLRQRQEPGPDDGRQH